jgi:hypothetical protein
MKDQLRLAIAFSNAFDRAQTLDERHQVIDSAEHILVRRAKRAMGIRAENNSARIAMMRQNAPAYKAMRSSAIRLQNSLIDPKLVSLIFS